MNIILISIDTVRPDRLGCYGYDRPTPNIDSLAEDGILFENAITNGTYTKSAFPPLLSSTYASMYGGPFHSVGMRRPMLAKVLNQNGYHTAGFTSNPLLGTNVGYNEGFERFMEPVPPPESRRWLQIKGSQRLLSSVKLNRILKGIGVDTKPRPVYVRGDQITDLGLNWLREVNSPFFLWLHYMDAHWPYHDPEIFSDAKLCAQAWHDRRVMWGSRRTFPGSAMLTRLNQLYDQSISRLDREIGRIIFALSSLDVVENTIITVVSDHGEAFYEHGRWQHGAVFDFYEEILRVPLIIKGPELPAGNRVTGLVNLLDIAPTLLELLEIEVPSAMEGGNLFDKKNDRQSQSPLVISEMVDLDWYAVAIRTDHYKYVFDEKRPNERMLFDLYTDPQEIKNIVGLKPDVEFELEVKLQSHLERVKSENSRDSYGNWQVEEDVTRRLRSLGYID